MKRNRNVKRGDLEAESAEVLICREVYSAWHITGNELLSLRADTQASQLP
jgi:hypothetical protein